MIGKLWERAWHAAVERLLPITQDELDALIEQGLTPAEGLTPPPDAVVFHSYRSTESKRKRGTTT